jgi:hypothetical protein
MSYFQLIISEMKNNSKAKKSPKTGSKTASFKTEGDKKSGYISSNKIALSARFFVSFVNSSLD